MSIYLTSDLHLNHNQPFIYEARGFKSIYEMNDAIIHNWNNIITEDDDVYVLGDLMMGTNEAGISLLHSLRGCLHIIIGNHDTESRCELYNNSYNVVEVVPACYLTYNKYHFFLTHYPCITTTDPERDIKRSLCNLFGHTHQKTNFYNDSPFIYHVGVDSHDCKPILIDDIIAEIEERSNK